MRALAGSIIILAGAIVLAAAVHGTEICRAAGRSPGDGATGGTFAAVLLGIVGLLVLISGLRDGDRPTTRP